MENTTTTTTFLMSAFQIMEGYKHWMVFLFLLLYLIALFLNSTVVFVISSNKELHQPMNFFTCVLSVNEIYGCTAMLPSIMALLLLETPEVPIGWCLAQVYFLHTYGSEEFSILALMGYDRYLAICNPLHYHTIMSRSKICKLITLVVVYPLIVFGCHYSLTLQLNFCGRVIPKLYCVNFELVKHSCTSVPHISIIGLAAIFLLIVPHIVMIVFSYAQIAKVCMKLNKESQTKALKTCIPHLLSVVNYSVGVFFEILQTRFNMNHLAMEMRIFLSLYFVIIPSIANPVLYGLGIQLVRVSLIKLFSKQKTELKRSTARKLVQFSSCL